MDFFKQLAALGKVDLNIRIMQKDDKLTISINPGNKSNITPVIITGTPAEIDAEFLNSIAPQVQSISGIVTNIQEVKQEAEKLEEESKKPKEKPKTEKPKAETKKLATKATEPNLFGEDVVEAKEESSEDNDDTNENK